MNNGKVDWKGCLVAVVTPFRRDGAIDEAAFVENIELLLAEGADGIVVAGCTGESWSLEPDEKLRLFALAVGAAKGRVPVIGGTGAIVTGKVIELSAAAKAAGVSGVMVLPPYYAVPNRREVVAHYRAISAEARVPILLYNIPKRTGINMLPDWVAELSEIEYVAGIKESSNDFIQLERTLSACGERIRVLAGHSAERGVAAVLMGCPGWVSSMETQIMGREAISMYDLAVAGRVEEARRIQLRCLKLDFEMRAGVGTFPANLKAAMNLLGRPGGFARPPLLDLSEAERGRAAEILASLGLAAARRAAE
ncbi:MAG: 4-hydroxy-tetrahydrodipicolinate synthase [Proteobacteria bacterium]|nr:4-hydroxy-tetrahydrodipicolinate synthase [Pseudomonadota bacterium]